MESIPSIQMAMAQLPHHVLMIDLLVFRQTEFKTPTPWPELARWCIQFLEAIKHLRHETIESQSRSWTFAPHAATSDPPFTNMPEARFDIISLESLREAHSWAQSQTPYKHPLTQDPAREQFAAMLEERLRDVLLEVGYNIRRQRRAPKKTPEYNPFFPYITRVEDFLSADTATLFVALGRQIGPIRTFAITPKTAS